MSETTVKKQTLAEALVNLQAALPVLPKDTSNPFFKSKYTSLDTITELIFPIMTKFGFAWVTMPGIDEGSGVPVLNYRLLHVSGESLDGSMQLFLKNQDPQGQGSAITYARRYAITAVLGLVSDEDDDGNAAQAAAKAAKTIDPPAPEEPAKDVREDVEPISKDQITSLMNAIKIKSNNKATKETAIEALNQLAGTIRDVPFTDLTHEEGEKLAKQVAALKPSAVALLIPEVEVA